MRRHRVLLSQCLHQLGIVRCAGRIDCEAQFATLREMARDTTVDTRAPDARNRSTIALASGELSVRTSHGLRSSSRGKLLRWSRTQEGRCREPLAQVRPPRQRVRGCGLDALVDPVSLPLEGISGQETRRCELGAKNGWDRSRCLQPRAGLRLLQEDDVRLRLVGMAERGGHHRGFRGPLPAEAGERTARSHCH